MELESGNYHIEVSSSNYVTQKMWIKLNVGENKKLTFRLIKAKTLSVLQEAVGSCFGTTGKINEEEARMLFIRAAEKDDPLAKMWIAFCQYCGLCSFSKNKAFAKEKAKGVINKIKSLANEGNGEAMFLLAIAYNEGLAISQNHVKAVYWYQNAAEKGHATAMTNLGYMYQEGEGVLKDDAHAAYWYQKAAEKNHAFGIYNLGTAYENGAGVQKDEERAVSLYRKASEKGFYLAQKRLKELGY
jgi:TPR repeat protein